MFGCMLKLVALGKLIAVDSASPPSGGLASGCHDLWASRTEGRQLLQRSAFAF